MAAKKKKTPQALPFDMADLVPTLGVLMIAVGKFGDLAERFVNAHETIAGNVERLTKLAEDDGIAEIRRATDAMMQLAEAANSMHRDAMRYVEYDQNRTG